jgi:hypothetical protein
MLNFETELFRGGLLTTITLKEHDRDVIELTIKRLLKEDNKELVNNHTSMFFSRKQLTNFLMPLINYLKENLDNEQTEDK